MSQVAKTVAFGDLPPTVKRVYLTIWERSSYSDMMQVIQADANLAAHVPAAKVKLVNSELKEHSATRANASKTGKAAKAYLLREITLEAAKASLVEEVNGIKQPFRDRVVTLRGFVRSCDFDLRVAAVKMIGKEIVPSEKPTDGRAEAVQQLEAWIKARNKAVIRL